MIAASRGSSISSPNVGRGPSSASAAGCSSRCATWMVKRGEIVNLGGLWLQSYGLSVRSEVMGRFYRERRAASSLQLQSEVASCQ